MNHYEKEYKTLELSNYIRKLIYKPSFDYVSMNMDLLCPMIFEILPDTFGRLEFTTKFFKYGADARVVGVVIQDVEYKYNNQTHIDMRHHPLYRLLMITLRVVALRMCEESGRELRSITVEIWKNGWVNCVSPSRTISSFNIKITPCKNS